MTRVMSKNTELAHFLTRFDLLALDAIKERAQSVVVVLRPAFVRMIVALRALDADTHEKLRGGFGTIARVLGRTVEIRGRCRERAALRHDEGADESLVGHVLTYGGDQPAVKLVARAAAIDPAHPG